MLARDYWKAVTVDRSQFLEQFLAFLNGADVRHCIVGGQAVNAYVEPVVSLDLDLVIALSDLAALESELAQRFHVERFPHSLNVSMQDSDLRVQIQTDARYEAFLEGAAMREVLGVPLPVARVEDVLQGKIWAASDAARRGSKRQKDLADIARLLEAYPHLRAMVPDEIQRRLL